MRHRRRRFRNAIQLVTRRHLKALFVCVCVCVYDPSATCKNYLATGNK